MIYKTIHRKQKIEHNTNPTKVEVEPRGAPDVWAVTTLLVTPVVLLLNDTNIIWYGNHVGQQYIRK
jgi:hypothetical protein